ncbi:DUF2911 domain-containing protein [Ascidiimonas sp. W6]|uniref:DUF2911 domain-containing protein n=1 Tax=Ascidiimonas meishanensis TaxID=3128903 RepID=UPI0030EDE63C
MFRNFSLIGLFLCFGTFTNAQITHPKSSPHAIIQQEAGLTNFIVDYSRPAVRGREIFGELVPYGRIWRVGANESTKLTISQEVTIMGNKLRAGTYALYAFPKENIWEIVFHKNTSHWGDGREEYNPAEDAFRIEVSPEEIKDFQENFTISFNEIGYESLYMDWRWAYTRIRIPIKLNTHLLMMEEIEKQLKNNPNATSFYQAARYLQEQNKQLNQSLIWLKKAETLEGSKYYISRVRSLVYASLGQYKKAINSAENSLKMSQALGKDEFVRINMYNIKKWKVKLIN